MEETRTMCWGHVGHLQLKLLREPRQEVAKAVFNFVRDVLRLGHDVKLHAARHLLENVRVVVGHEVGDFVHKRLGNDLRGFDIVLETLNDLSHAYSLRAFAPGVIVRS